jgi:hypothetical protein
MLVLMPPMKPPCGDAVADGEMAALKPELRPG